MLLLGDQPGVSPATVDRLIDTAAAADVGVCQYRDGVGHPFWLSRSTFGELAGLHGDKGVWKLIDARAADVCRVTVDATVPLDVDTWDDYRRLFASVPR